MGTETSPRHNLLRSSNSPDKLVGTQQELAADGQSNGAASGDGPAPPSRVMHSRRLMLLPSVRRSHPTTFVVENAALCITAKLAADGRDGSQADAARWRSHVRFSPESRQKV